MATGGLEEWSLLLQDYSTFLPCRRPYFRRTLPHLIDIKALTFKWPDGTPNAA
jgi:hypothetical protein